MIQIEHTREFRVFMVEKQFRKKVRTLTTYLITALNINPHGRELVGICGQGGEADNTEAIYTWVKQEACCASCIRELTLTVLQKRFVRFLLDNSHQQEYYE